MEFNAKNMKQLSDEADKERNAQKEMKKKLKEEKNQKRIKELMRIAEDKIRKNIEEHSKLRTCIVETNIDHNLKYQPNGHTDPVMHHSNLLGDSQLMYASLIDKEFDVGFKYYDSDGTGDPLEYTGGFNMVVNW